MIEGCGAPLGEENRSGLCKPHYIALARRIKEHPADPRHAAVLRQLMSRVRKG